MNAIVDTRKSRRSVPSEFEKIRADYDMSRENRFIRRRKGLAPSGGPADYHYRIEADYYRDIEKSRDMDRNDSIIGQTVDRSVSNIVQDGFSLDPQTGDKGLNTELFERFKAWGDDPVQCDVAEENTWHDYETSSMRSVLVDGDCVVLAIEEGQLQFIEAHEVQTSTKQPDTVLGVTKDHEGRRLKYWIMQDAINPQAAKEQAEPYETRNSDGFRQLFHIYNARRMSLTRGVTAFAPIFSVAGFHEDIQFAKLVQQQVASCFAIFREQPVVGGGPLPNKSTDYGQSVIETSPAGVRYIENIAPGMEITGSPGEKLQGFSANIPNAEYFQQVKLILQIIGVNLGLPLCLVLMDGSETNFSGWRGAVDEARKGFRSNQRNLTNRLHTPVYRWKVASWIAEDDALRSAHERLGDLIYKHKWNAPRWSYIDPVGDAQGDQLRLQNGLTSPRRLHAERGAEWDEVVEEIVSDMGTMIRRAKREAMAINDEFKDGQPVQWRECANLPMPIGVQMAMQDPKALTLQERDQKEVVANVQ